MRPYRCVNYKSKQGLFRHTERSLAFCSRPGGSQQKKPPLQATGHEPEGKAFLLYSPPAKQAARPLAPQGEEALLRKPSAAAKNVRLRSLASDGYAEGILLWI